MKNPDNSSVSQLLNIIDQYSLDILNASDAEILERAKEAGLNPKDLADSGKSLLLQAETIAKRNRLAKAKSGAINAKSRAKDNDVSSFSDAAKARSFIEQCRKSHPTEISLAARNGEKMDDADAINLANQLSELIEKNSE